jgi:hypothetical protein
VNELEPTQITVADPYCDLIFGAEDDPAAEVIVTPEP